MYAVSAHVPLIVKWEEAMEYDPCCESRSPAVRQFRGSEVAHKPESRSSYASQAAPMSFSISASSPPKAGS
jgi:hypothetical protein